MLLILLLFVALLSIGMLAIVERIEFQIKRDREEELIHRGVQYSRAVRRFVNTLGRYPKSVEELESTNNVRYLRKRYKDPITGKDFRILRLGDVDYLNVGTSGGGAEGSESPHPQRQVPQGTVSKTTASSGPELDADSGVEKTESGDAGNQQSDSGDDVASNPASQSESNPAEATSTPKFPWSDQLPLTIDHRAMLGVASTSNGKTIREFRGQNKYNRWLFIYTPLNDRAGLFQTPDQRRLDASAQVQEPTSAARPSPEQSDPSAAPSPEQPVKQ